MRVVIPCAGTDPENIRGAALNLTGKNELS